MEATPAQGVQIRTAGGRVATVTLNDMGWYSATLDNNVDLARDEGGAGESIKKQRSFFAADQGELLRTVPRPDRDRSKHKSDTPMPLRGKDGAIVYRTTMLLWSSTSGRDVPEGHEPHHVIEVKVPKGWTTAKWSPSAGPKKINHATVDGHKVKLDGPASTSRGADGRHVLDIKKLKFPPRGEVRDRDSEYNIGTDARDNDPWRKGAVHRTGKALRSLLTAEVFDEEETVRVASERYVNPSKYPVRDGCHLREVGVATFNGHGMYHFGCRAETPDEAIRLCAVGAIGNTLEHLKIKNIKDSPYYQRLPQDWKDAALAAREGRPWKVQRLDDFKAPMPIGTQTYLVKGGGQRHKALVGPGKYQRMPSAKTAFETAQRRNPHCKAKAERDRATALKYHELCKLDGRTPKYELPEEVGTFAGAPGTGGRKAAHREMLLLDAADAEATYVVSKQIEGIRAAPPGALRRYDVLFVGRDRGLSDYLLQKRDRIWGLAEKEDDALAAFRRLALAEKFHEDVLRAAGHTVIKSDETFLEYYDWFSMLKGGKNVIKEALVLAPKATPSAEINQRPASRSWCGAHAVDLPRASAAFARGTGPMRTKI